MKRFYCFALVLLTLLASVYFSACGNKYKNLNMQFVNVDGEQVSSVELVIDANNPEKAQARLGVKFSGIKTADIGNVSVWCVEGKAIVSNASFSGDTYYFTLSAENVSNIGADKVKVIHLSSKKEIELDLSIGKKATTLSANKKNYIISIPYQASRTMSVDASLLVNIDGTDEVGLVLDTTSFDTGLTATYKTVGGVSMLDKFTITSDLEDGYNVLAHPVCFMDGYDVLYADEPTSPEQNNLVNLVFKKVLNDDSVVITTDADHTSDANGVYDGSEIILISNDHTAVKDYRYDTFSVELSHIDPITGEIGRIDNVNKNYLNYYQYELISSDENIYAHIENNLIYIQALSRTDSATVEICLNPKNSVGEIESVSKIVKVRGETKPEGISIKMQGKDVSGKVDLYDTYANSRAGARFEFIPDDAFIDLQQMQIMLSPTILNTKNGNLGVNEVYYDENFEQLQDLDEVANARQNAYLLDFYFNSQNQPIKFYYDSLNERFISETILSTSQVFIKYEENPNYSASSPISQLEISLTTKYSGNLPYLEGIAGCDEVSLVFENQQGVADTNIFDGHINKPAGVAEIIDYANQVGELGVDNVGKDSFSQTIELNRNNGVDNDNGMGAYVIYIREVVGDKSNNILSTKFSVSVSGGKDNPLKIKQFDLLLDGNGKLDPSQGSTEISEFNYNKNDSVNNSILLLFNSSTDVGEYTITITHGNGYEKTITAHIIVSPSVEDFKDAIIHNIKENEENDNSAYNYINRRADGSYKYDVEADFIVATNVGVSGRNVEFAISLNDNILNSGVVVPNSYACSAKANGDRFIQISPRRNDPTLFDLVFKEGSKVDGVDYVVEVEFKVSIFTYAYLAKQEDVTQDLTCSFTFFIYEPVENEDIELSPSTSAITRYPYEYLGAYYKDYANLDLSLTIDDNLKQYLHIPTFNAVGVNGFETYSVLGEQGKNVLWLSSQPVASGDDLEQEDYSLVTNIHGVGLVNQRVEIYGFVRQYSRTIFKGFVVIIERPIVSDRVEISTNLDVNQAGQYLYLNLKDKEVKKIDASSYSETGNQTFGNDVVMVAVDGGGNTIATSALEIDNDSSEIIVNGMVNGARLLVFAKDALYQTITSGQQIYPDEFLLDGHKGAYQEFNLLLSDGSEKNPFIVKNADDFWAMRTDENSRGVYYSLLANINLNTANEQKSPLPNLYANFSSYEMEGETYVYSIYGITLNNSFRNLIGGVYGSISNINFEYTAAYSGAVEGNLGLIAENRGTLTNVSLNISGNAQLQSGSVFFGGLKLRIAGNV